MVDGGLGMEVYVSGLRGVVLEGLVVKLGFFLLLGWRLRGC